jgi:UDP-N-acetylmuramate--alanine ligase
MVAPKKELRRIMTENRAESIEPRPLPADDSLADLSSIRDLGKVWFIGIGGSGMSVLAEMLHQLGIPVAGSDRTKSHYTEHLRSLGIPVTIGQSASNIHDCQTAVWSSAIAPDMPEMLAARRQHLRLAHRSDILALLLRSRKSIAVAGTHGKTTTSSMIATIFAHASGQAGAEFADPSFAIGGSVKTSRGVIPGGHVGAGKWMVAEADESDGSFEKYHPAIGVITNAEGDHLDHYGTVENYRRAFARFVPHVVRNIVICADDEGARQVWGWMSSADRARSYVYSTNSLDQCAKLGMDDLSADRFVHILSSAEEAASDSAAEDREHPQTTAVQRGVADASDRPDDSVEEKFTLDIPAALASSDHRQTLTIGLRVPGIHNARNATAALMATALAGMPIDQIVAGLEAFLGAARRFDFCGEVNGIRLYNDYGHHPTEVATFLTAVRRRFPGHTIRILFQPHTYSRTKTFCSQLVDALNIADDVWLSHLFAAREKASDFPGISSATLVREAQKRGIGGKFHLVDDMHEAGRQMADASAPGDILSTVGGGDINLANPDILDELSRTADRS